MGKGWAEAHVGAAGHNLKFPLFRIDHASSTGMNQSRCPHSSYRLEKNFRMEIRRSDVLVALLLAMCIASGSGQGLPLQPRPAFPSLPISGPLSRLFQALAPEGASAAGMAPSTEEVQVWQAREKHQTWEADLHERNVIEEPSISLAHCRLVLCSQVKDNTVARPILLYICKVGR